MPGTVAGLATAHRAYATVPWRELVEPAAELARGGFELIPPQAYLHAIVDLILRHTDEGRAVYGRDGQRLVAGDRVVLPATSRRRSTGSPTTAPTTSTRASWRGA